eukprot:1160814-Pelagomonas_calceolata.AAC.12
MVPAFLYSYCKPSWICPPPIRPPPHMFECAVQEYPLMRALTHTCAQELQAIMDLPTSNPPSSSTPLALPFGSRTSHSPHKLGMSSHAPAGEVGWVAGNEQLRVAGMSNLAPAGERAK